MDMIYFEHPLFVLFPIFLLSLQILTYFLSRKKQPSTFVSTLLTAIGVVGHAVAITVILLNGGTLSDVLVLVLLGGALSLFLSPTPNRKEQE